MSDNKDSRKQVCSHRWQMDLYSGLVCPNCMARRFKVEDPQHPGQPVAIDVSADKINQIQHQQEEWEGKGGRTGKKG